MAAPFVGNQDYRGYLNYLGKQGDSTANQLLGYVGNDAKFGVPTNTVYGGLLTANDNFYKAYQGYSDPARTTMPSIYGSGGGAPPPVYAPKLDTASIYAKARTQAENAVNPFYTKQLNDFLAQQGALKQQRQEQYTTDIGNYKQALKDTEEANALNKERTGEDAALKQTNINTANDNNQVDTGNTFEDQRLQAARDQATSGVLGSGAGNRATAVATTARNTTEGRQNDQFQEQRQQADLFKNRTFEDLAKSTELATTGEATKEKQATFDLDSYIQNAGFNEQDQRNKLEEARLQRVAQESGSQAKLLFNNYLAGISNPAQYEAAVRTYGGSF